MSDTGDAAMLGESPASLDPFWGVHQGDARHLGALLEAGSRECGTPDHPFIKATITSPPYATLVDYGSDDQVGFGQSYAEYLKSCKSVFAQIFDWTVSTGSMWVVADSFMERKQSGLPSRFVPLPFELAAQAESVGWTLKEVVIWKKDRTRPWSHRGKLRNAFEYVLFFVKSDEFTFNVDRLRDTGTLKSWWVKYPERHNPWGMAPDNVWEIPIPVQGSWDRAAFHHACPFPPELVRRMLSLSTEVGDVVFDPFAGSGTVVSTALTDGRRGLGVELNKDYVAAFKDGAPSKPQGKSTPYAMSVMTQRLIELRMLKYPKDLANQVIRAGFTTSQVLAVMMEVSSINYAPARTGYGSIVCSVVVSDRLSEFDVARLTKLVDEVSLRPPLSKYGLESVHRVIGITEAATIVATKEVSIYTKGRSWNASTSIPGTDLEQWLRSASEPTVVPVLSPLRVHQTLEETN